MERREVRGSRFAPDCLRLNPLEPEHCPQTGLGSNLPNRAETKNTHHRFVRWSTAQVQADLASNGLPVQAVTGVYVLVTFLLPSGERLPMVVRGKAPYGVRGESYWQPRHVLL